LMFRGKKENSIKVTRHAYFVQDVVIRGPGFKRRGMASVGPKTAPLRGGGSKGERWSWFARC